MKKITYKIFMVCLFIAAVIISTTAVYAWRTYSTDAKKLALQVTRIDSLIYVYQGLDTNYNGLPDLLINYTSEEIANMNINHPSDKKNYYAEDKAFNYLGYRYALSTDVMEEEKINYSIENIFPTMVSTLKMSIVNNSDGTNWASFSFDSKNFTDADLKLLRCLSVRVGMVYNNTGDINHIATSVVFSDKYYFNDNISTNFDGFNVISGDDAVEVKGMVNRNSEINDDVVDMWFQFEMEAYEDLLIHSQEEGANAFNLTQNEYNLLQNKQITLPDLKVILEVRV